MNRISRTIHGFVRCAAFAFAACTGAAALVGATPAFAAPLIDGSIDDMVTFAQSLQSSHTGFGLYITDQPDGNGNPVPENIYNDLKFIPCPSPQPSLGTHWVNGVEIFKHVLAYESGSTKLYLGLRAEGFIGDTDGNGNPDNAGGGTCNPNDNIKDTIGISGNELYSWSFDLNCDGVTDGVILIQDNIITGTGTLAGITGTMAFRQGGLASGRDLEMEINLTAPLPPSFNFVRVEANAFDGLSEDRSDGAPLVGTPGIAVAKTATPSALCVGQTTRFTITVSNTGQTSLSVVAVDQLPAQLSYAGNVSSSCGVGAPVVNGQQLTFPAFNLAAGANCTISFDALAGPQCAGSQNNVVDVTGTFTSACVPEPGSEITTAHGEFAVVCRAGPCVQVSAAGPPSACPGTPVTINGTVTNCSPGTETIVVRVNGAQAYNQSVGAGQTVSWSYQATMPACTAGQNSPFAVEASATTECGTDTKSTNVLVACKSRPCVELAAGGPPSACTGTQITISGKVHNCSLDSETIVVTVDGQSAFNGPVAAGADQNWSLQLPMKDCAASQSVTYAVLASTSSACGQDQKSAQVTVLCGAPPCVTLELNAPPQACAGTTIQLCGTVTNCSPSAESIEVHFGDQSQRFDGVAPGASRNYCFSVLMQACTTGDTRSFTVTATALNDCGRQDKTAVDETQCKVPLIKVKKAGESTVADGAILHYTVIVENGGEVDLQNVFVRDTLCPYTVYNNNANPPTYSAPSIGQNGQVVWRLDLLRAGESRALTFEAKASLAAGGYTGCPTAATCRNNVEAEGSCAGSDGSQTVKAQDDLVTTITCGTAGCAPTLTVDKTVSPSGPVAPGTTLHYTIRVSNPGTSAVEGVVATDYLCSDATYANNANPAPGSAPSVGSTGNVVWNLGTIEAGGTRTLTFDAKIRSDIDCGGTDDLHYGGAALTSGSCTNVVKVTGHCGDAQAYAEDSVQTSIQCTACAPKLSVEKTVSPSGPVAPGTTLHYTIKVRNTGSDAVDGVVATDSPCDFTKYAGNANPAPSWAPSVGSTGNVVWNLGTIEAGGTRTLTFDANVRSDIRCDGDGHDGDDDDDDDHGDDLWGDDGDDDDPTDRTCSNYVKVVGHCGDTKAYAQAKAEVTIECVGGACAPKLKVEKTVTPYGPVDPGTTLHYTIKVSNPGTGPVDGVVATDYGCDVANYAGNASPAPNSAPSVGSTGSVVWNLGTLEAGGTRTLTFDAKVRSEVRCGDDDDDDDDHGDDLWDDDGDDDEEATCASRVKVAGHCGDVKAYAEATAKTSINCSKISDNCPHSCDDWKDDCSDSDGRYSHDQMVAIAERVDASSSFYNWASGTDLSRFSAIVNSSPSTAREKAKRQFVVLLANRAVGQLHLVGRDGSRVNLDADTPVRFSGFNATTIGGLTAEIDAQLVSLEGRNESDAGVTAQYGAIAGSCLALNNGQGIPLSDGCRNSGGDDDAQDAGSSNGTGTSAQLYRAAPNPFSSTTQFAYEVTEDRANVDITVFDVAGRRIRGLVETTLPAGRYIAAWDGKSDDGVQVTRGVYFVRTVIAGTKAQVQRLLFIRDGR